MRQRQERLHGLQRLEHRLAGDQGVVRSVSIALFRRPWLRGSLLLSGPLGWMLLIYIAALVALFVSAFWTVDPFTGEVVHDWGLKNFRTIFESDTYRTIAL